jgi:cytochrome c oxidase assembly protein subunit 20
MPEETQTTTTPFPTEPKRYLEPPPDHPANEYTRVAVPGVTDAVKSIKLDDFKKVHTQPCFRDAYLWGMSGGFAAGGLKFIAGGMDMDSFGATAGRAAGKVLN